jgi:hypothetical protein
MAAVLDGWGEEYKRRSRKAETARLGEVWVLETGGGFEAGEGTG